MASLCGPLRALWLCEYAKKRDAQTKTHHSENRQHGLSHLHTSGKLSQVEARGGLKNSALFRLRPRDIEALLLSERGLAAITIRFDE